MIPKQYRLEKDDIQIINNLKEEKELSSEVEALRYIIRDWKKRQQKEIGTQNAILRSMEEKQDILLDVVNTLLIREGIEICQPVSFRESPVIKKSREYRKIKLGHLKQSKDWQNRKKGK